MIETASYVPVALAKRALIKVYNESIAGKMGAIDYEGGISNLNDVVRVRPAVGSKAFHEIDLLPIDKELVFQMRHDVATINSPYALGEFINDAVLKIQCRLDREILTIYPCETKYEFAFAAQLFCTVESTSTSLEFIVTFRFIYGHKFCGEEQ